MDKLQKAVLDMTIYFQVTILEPPNKMLGLEHAHHLKIFAS